MKKFISLIFVAILVCGIVNCAFAVENWRFTNSTSDLMELDKACESAFENGFKADALSILLCKTFLEDGYSNEVVIVTNEDEYSYDVGFYDLEIGFTDNLFGLTTENFTYVIGDVDKEFCSYWALVVKAIAEENDLLVKIH